MKRSLQIGLAALFLAGGCATQKSAIVMSNGPVKGYRWAASQPVNAYILKVDSDFRSGFFDSPSTSIELATVYNNNSETFQIKIGSERAEEIIDFSSDEPSVQSVHVFTASVLSADPPAHVLAIDQTHTNGKILKTVDLVFLRVKSETELEKSQQTDARYFSLRAKRSMRKP